MTTQLFLVDDPVAGAWLPFTLTRPAGEVLFGTETLRARVERVLGLACEGYVTEARLTGFDEVGAPPCIVSGDIPDEGDRLLVWSRFVPDESAVAPSGPPAVLEAGGVRVGLWAPRGSRLPEDWSGPASPGWRVCEVAGTVLESVWDLMAKNPGQILRDGEGEPDSPCPPSTHRIGGHVLSLAPDAVEVEPGVVFDLREGPVILREGVHVSALTRIAGPAFVGPGSRVLGGFLSRVGIGPMCKIRGEVESTVVLGFTNKAHDGFLGHAVLGRWVNLGAMTTNSDLKNNYGPVRMEIRGQEIETGAMKVGCFLGDHVRTGIGTMLNTGTVVEAASNLFGGAMPPKYVPPFSWGSGSRLQEYDFEKFIETASFAMSRRGVELSPSARRLYETAFTETRGLRSALD